MDSLDDWRMKKTSVAVARELASNVKRSLRLVHLGGILPWNRHWSRLDCCLLLVAVVHSHWHSCVVTTIHSHLQIRLGGIAMGQTRHLVLTNLGSSQRRVVVVGLVGQELEELEMAVG